MIYCSLDSLPMNESVLYNARRSKEFVRPEAKLLRLVGEVARRAGGVEVARRAGGVSHAQE